MEKKKKEHEAEKFELAEFKYALLVGVYESKEKELCISHLDELESLCTTYGLLAADKIACPLRKIDPGTYLGKGKIEELGSIADELKAEIIIFDDEISPKQQRNLEAIFGKPVIDRTELILEVFAKAAKTKEARLQVELAKVRYQLPRLKRLWTHLSRQASGKAGFSKGEGEKQIEIDRRLVRARVDQLRKELEEVKAQRELQRRARLRSETPTFAIVGYTNVGKSTLLNALTEAGVLVEDKLFATLDTTSRKFSLPNKQEVVLIDTVGFIRKIPHTLVAAFRSTLEEVLFTDILLHLVDVSHPMAEEQAEESMEILKELKAQNRPVITVLNKIDQCENPLIIQKFRLKYPKVIAISALKGEGFDDLTKRMIEELSNLRQIVDLRIPQKQFALVSEINRRGKILASDYVEDDILLKVEIPKAMEHKVSPYHARSSERL